MPSDLSYTVVYFNSGAACEDSLPTVEVASRFRSAGQCEQPFSEWSLVQYYTGERSSSKTTYY